MADFSTSIVSLATRIGTECKTISSNIGSLTSLTTDAKTSLVDAMNELDAIVSSLESSSAASVGIDDETESTTTTYSSSKIASEISSAIATAKEDLLNGAGEAYDTLKELADLIETNASAIEALEALAAGHVKYDEAQELTTDQQARARENIGAASAEDLDALEESVGDMSEDLVSVFEAALADTEETTDTEESTDETE